MEGFNRTKLLILKVAFKYFFSLLLQFLVQQLTLLGIFFFVFFILNSWSVSAVKHEVTGRTVGQIKCLANCCGI